MFNVPECFTVEQVAGILAVSEKSVRDFIRAGELEATKVGQWRISREALAAFMKSRKNLFQSEARKEVLDFLDRDQPLTSGEQRTLLILDYHTSKPRLHAQLVNSLSQGVQGDSFHWKFLYDKKLRRARHILRGELQVILPLAAAVEKKVKGVE